jgi:3-hydroxybutyryl-CoA dehydrogenase
MERDSGTFADGKRVGVVGGGTMGVGIVYVFAMAGIAVHLVEPDSVRAQAVMPALNTAAAGAIQRGKMDAALARQRLGGVTIHEAVSDLPDALDLVIETVPERRELKLRVLGDIAARKPALIATNTSALSVDDLASAVTDATRFLGMHFFNPVWSLMLVEVIRGTQTDEASLKTACDFVVAIGKSAAVVSDSPGFATSRLDLVQALEAIRMVEEGVATPADIDRAITTAYRHPIGPLRLCDMVGLDVRLDIARHLEQALGPHFAPPLLLEQMVARGDLGVKSGRGFYDWPDAALTQKQG